jgi:hypothetical protein
VAVLVTACAAGIASTSVPATPTAIQPEHDMSAMHSAPNDPSLGTLSWLVGGIPRPIPGAVPVAGDVLARIDLRAGSSRTHRLLDLHLLHAGSRAAATPDSVMASGDMRDMPHGSFRRQADVLGGGMYRLDLPLEMPGVWEVTVQIADGATKTDIRISIDLPE